jgi:hypothetical protein
MNVVGLVITAFSAISLNGLFLALYILQRRETRTMRVRLHSAKQRAANLRVELDAAVATNRDLADALEAVTPAAAPETVEQTVELDPLEQLWRSPAVVPNHEQGNQ